MTKTIKVAAALRDRLCAEADHAGLTLSQLLEVLLEDRGRQRRVQSVRSAMEVTPPALYESWRDETAVWGDGRP